MPTYVYEAIEEKGCKHCQEEFEVVQSIKDDSLVQCPECGVAIQRVIQAVCIASSLKKNLLSDKNLKKNGFTKLVNEGNGQFRKVT